MLTQSPENRGQLNCQLLSALRQVRAAHGPAQEREALGRVELIKAEIGRVYQAEIARRQAQPPPPAQCDWCAGPTDPANTNRFRSAQICRTCSARLSYFLSVKGLPIESAIRAAREPSPPPPPPPPEPRTDAPIPADMPLLRGIAIGRCVAGLDFGATTQAHAHNDRLRDRHYGWVCFRPGREPFLERTLLPTDTLLHEYAHLQVLEQGHTDRWRREYTTLQVEYENRRFGPRPTCPTCGGTDYYRDWGRIRWTTCRPCTLAQRKQRAAERATALNCPPVAAARRPVDWQHEDFVPHTAGALPIDYLPSEFPTHTRRGEVRVGGRVMRPGIDDEADWP